MGIASYIKNTKAEMKHVVWPSRRQIITFTVVVVVISLVIAYYLGLFDWVFSTLLGFII